MPKIAGKPQRRPRREIAKFEAVASHWWDLEGEFKPLHRINPLRLGYIAERAGGLFGKRCSMSVVAAAFWPRVWREGATVTGLDMGFEPLQVAKLHALESGIQWITCRKPWKSTRQNMPDSMTW